MRTGKTFLKTSDASIIKQFVFKNIKQFIEALFVVMPACQSVNQIVCQKSIIKL